jgi:hypothetical protein
VEFNWVLIIGVVWMLVNLFSRKSEKGPRPRTLPSRPPPGARDDASGADPTQREGSQLERLLRELERNLGEAAGVPSRPQPAPRAPSLPLPEAEDVEERTSLEEPERVISLENEVVRAPRQRYDHDAEADGIVQRRIAAAQARSGELTRADHARFDERIREEVADHTSVRRYSAAQLRDAVVWREILGPPVSERDP